MKHSPSIALAAAYRELQSASEGCPHWDYDTDGDCRAECCYRVSEAKLALASAIRKARQ